MKQSLLLFIIASVFFSGCTDPNKQSSHNAEDTPEQTRNTVQKTFWDCSFGDTCEEVKNKLTEEEYKNIDVNRNHSLISINDVTFNDSYFEYATFFFDENDVLYVVSFHKTFNNFKDASKSFDDVKDKYPFKQAKVDDERYKLKYEYSDGDNKCEYFIFENRDSTYLEKLMYKSSI